MLFLSSEFNNVSSELQAIFVNNLLAYFDEVHYTKYNSILQKQIEKKIIFLDTLFGQGEVYLKVL